MTLGSPKILGSGPGLGSVPSLLFVFHLLLKMIYDMISLVRNEKKIHFRLESRWIILYNKTIAFWLSRFIWTNTNSLSNMNLRTKVRLICVFLTIVELGLLVHNSILVYLNNGEFLKLTGNYFLMLIEIFINYIFRSPYCIIGI